MSRRDCLTKKILFYLVGSPKVGGAGDGKHKKKYGHPYRHIDNKQKPGAGRQFALLHEDSIDSLKPYREAGTQRRRKMGVGAEKLCAQNFLYLCS